MLTSVNSHTENNRTTTEDFNHALDEIRSAVSHIPDRNFILIESNGRNKRTEDGINAYVPSTLPVKTSQSQLSNCPQPWSAFTQTDISARSNDIELLRLESQKVEQINAISTSLQSELRDEHIASARLTAVAKHNEGMVDGLSRKIQSVTSAHAQVLRAFQNKESVIKNLQEEVNYLREARKCDVDALKSLQNEKNMLLASLTIAQRVSTDKSFDSVESSNKQLQKQCTDQANQISHLHVLLQNKKESEKISQSTSMVEKLPTQTDSMKTDLVNFTKVCTILLGNFTKIHSGLKTRLSEVLSALDSRLESLDTIKACAKQHIKDASEAPEAKAKSVIDIKISQTHEVLLSSVSAQAKAVSGLVDQREAQNYELTERFTDSCFRFLLDEEKLLHCKNRGQRLKEERDEMQNSLFQLQTAHTNLIRTNESLNQKVTTSEREITEQKLSVRSLKQELKKLQNVTLPPVTSVPKRRRELNSAHSLRVPQGQQPQQKIVQTPNTDTFFTPQIGFKEQGENRTDGIVFGQMDSSNYGFNFQQVDLPNQTFAYDRTDDFRAKKKSGSKKQTRRRILTVQKDFSSQEYENSRSAS